MSKQNAIVILGAGEHGQVIKNVFRIIGKKKVIFLDDAERKDLTSGKLEDFKNYSSNQYEFFVALGDKAIRKKWFKKLIEKDRNIVNAIHPRAHIEKNVCLGKNVFVGANAYINVGTHIGSGVNINSGCIIEHDNVIEDFVEICPGVITGGRVSIRSNSFIGTGTTIIDHIIIEKNTMIGAGSVVIKNTVRNSLYVGVPAKLKKYYGN